jgi:hypothetical protein
MAAEYDAHERLVGLKLLDASKQVPREELDVIAEPEPMLTLAEAEVLASELNSPITAATLRRLIKSGALAGIRKGKSWMIEEWVLVSYLAHRPKRGRKPKA